MYKRKLQNRRLINGQKTQISNVIAYQENPNKGRLDNPALLIQFLNLKRMTVPRSAEDTK